MELLSKGIQGVLWFLIIVVNSVSGCCDVVEVGIVRARVQTLRVGFGCGVVVAVGDDAVVVAAATAVLRSGDLRAVRNRFVNGASHCAFGYV